ncbi:hypothetical protein AB1N83_010338 [Pleurotus pulmonarius]
MRDTTNAPMTVTPPICWEQPRPLSRRAPSSRCARHGPISVVRASSAHFRLSFLPLTAPHLSQYILELAPDLVPEGTPTCSPERTPQCFARMNRLRTLYLDDAT